MIRPALVLLAALGAQPAPAQTGAPLSAIDWLSQSVAPAATPEPTPARPLDEPPVADSAAAPEVTVAPLDPPAAEAPGLLSPAVTGLPRTLWSASGEDTLSLLVRAAGGDQIPALQDLVVTLMLAEADPPLPTGATGGFALARIDRLLDLGALEEAQALLEAADPAASPELFRRWFDVSLLTGTEDTACDTLEARPVLAPTLPARVFCLARSGDWNAAALTLNTARVLGDVSEEDEALLARFLDPDLFEGEPPLPPPTRPSPLVYRLREAIGEGLLTRNLPRAFAHADLRSTVAWRQQLEAAERLARVGAIDENRLLAIYTANTPAASGGIWDRAAAIQRLDRALAAGDAGAVAAALPAAWTAMREARTEVAFARLFGDRIAGLALDGEAGGIALRLGMLSPGYEAVALDAPAARAEQEPLWIAIARGDTGALPPPEAPHAAAIAAAFAGAPVAEPFASQLAEGRLGEALLRAVAAFDQGLAGEPAALTEALAVFRAVGLEDIARRAALQALILDRAG